MPSSSPASLREKRLPPPPRWSNSGLMLPTPSSIRIGSVESPEDSSSREDYTTVPHLRTSSPRSSRELRCRDISILVLLMSLMDLTRISQTKMSPRVRLPLLTPCTPLCLSPDSTHQLTCSVPPFSMVPLFGTSIFSPLSTSAQNRDSKTKTLLSMLL